jgi:hypothetical protein
MFMQISKAEKSTHYSRNYEKLLLLKPKYAAISDMIRSQDSAFGIATGYGLDDQGVGAQVPVGSRIFSSPRHPDWRWGPPSLLFNGYLELFPQG